jgi:lipid II:glycine glycyltransferase (peptidoglycan interpeptide bridge formation enzyme)
MTMTSESPLILDAAPAAGRPALDGAGRVAVHHADRDEWIALAAGFEDHNYRQCFDYAAMLAARSNAVAENVVVTEDDEPIGLASVRVKRLPGTGTGIAYLSGGPLVRRRDGARLERVLEALRAEYVDRRRLVLRIAPAIGDEAWNAEQDECLLAGGFLPGDHLRPYRTMMVDIGRPLADVRKGFAKKWRNLLSNAERRELRVTEGTDPGLFKDFEPLFDELVARKGIDVELGADFYAQLQPQLPESERLHVAIAWVDGAPAAGVVASIHGDTAVYLLGASNEVGRGTNAAYLLQWKVMEAASERGCRWYDLGGIDPVGNPGVFRFKERMGGAEAFSPGPYELAPSRLRGAAVRAAERAFRAIAARRK